MLAALFVLLTLYHVYIFPNYGKTISSLMILCGFHVHIFPQNSEIHHHPSMLPDTNLDCMTRMEQIEI